MILSVTVKWKVSPCTLVLGDDWSNIYPVIYSITRHRYLPVTWFLIRREVLALLVPRDCNSLGQCQEKVLQPKMDI